MEPTMRILSVAVAILLCATVRADEPTPPASKQLPDREELEKQFSETMTGATFVGHFTLGEVKPDAKLSEERYTITKASKLKDDYWLIQTRIQYGDHDVTLPLPLRVIWSGDTPVITLDQVPVPGLGTFTARVLVFKNQYAGTWSGKDDGGHLFGRIVRDEK
jgi:hypothetical protein